MVWSTILLETERDQGKEMVFDLTGIPRIKEPGGRLLGDVVALIHLSQKQTASIGGYPAPGKIGDDLFGEKVFKGQLVMTDCFPRYPA